MSDTGLGLSAGQLERLFEPFNRLGREHDSEGTGIGLVITRHLVGLMGGRLDVDSEAGAWHDVHRGAGLGRAAQRPVSEPVRRTRANPAGKPYWSAGGRPG